MKLVLNSTFVEVTNEDLLVVDGGCVRFGFFASILGGFNLKGIRPAVNHTHNTVTNVTVNGSGNTVNVYNY